MAQKSIIYNFKTKQDKNYKQFNKYICLKRKF